MIMEFVTYVEKLSGLIRKIEMEEWIELDGKKYSTERHYSEDLVFPGVSSADFTANLIMSFRGANLPEDILYAAIKTGRILTQENMHNLTQEELDEWDAEIAKYKSMSRKELRRYNKEIDRFLSTYTYMENRNVTN